MSNQDNAKRDELRQAWIDSLLISATKPQDHSQLIAEAMSQIESADQNLRDGSTQQQSRRILSRFVGWPTFGIAATILLAVLLTFRTDGSQTAMAAIQRSLDVAAQRLTRKYSLDVTYRPLLGKPGKVAAELYVQGNDRLAIRHPGLLPRTNFWLGRDGDQSWVVPAFGPVIKGGVSVLEGYLRSHEQLDTPYLHVSTMLHQMTSKGFHLKVLTDEEISVDDGRSFLCRHIQATASNSHDPELPHAIELWTSRETGMAVRMIARWDLAAGQPGRESVVITFQQDEPDLSNAWFTAEGHYTGRRPVIGPSNAGQETPGDAGNTQ